MCVYYKAILKPIRINGIQLWGTASISIIEILEHFQLKALRMIVSWHVSNTVIRRDLHTPTVKEKICHYSPQYSARLSTRPNTHTAHTTLGHPVPGGCKYEDLALQVGGVSNETVKHGLEFCGTSIREWLLWHCPEAIVQVNYRPILSSERMPHIKKPTIDTYKQIWPCAPDESPTPRQSYQLSANCKREQFDVC
jgi:hypothetical protein